MATPRAVAVVVLLLLPSTSGAQPAPSRVAAPLSVPAATLAAAINSENHDPGLLLLDIVRTAFDAPEAPATASGKVRERVLEALRSAGASGDVVPLPLPPKIWHDVILGAAVPDGELIAAIFNSRTAALMYYGLSALDDETLAWLAGERDVLLQIRKYPGTFAACGRSVRVHGGRVLVPGGITAAPLWQDVVGADPANPSAFLRALFRSNRGRVAFLYDTVAHLDAARQPFALTRRLGALAEVFHDFARDWDIETRPFARPQFDPSLLLTTVRVDASGNLEGPPRRSVWERVFRDDQNVDVPFREVPAWNSRADDPLVDAAWLANRIHLAAYSVGRRRLDTLLFAQRVLGGATSNPHETASVLRAFMAMPALMLTLERAGVRNPAAFLAAARHASAVNAIGDDSARRNATAAFQSAIAFVDRGRWSGALSPGAAQALVESVTAIPADRGRGYEARVASWLRTDLFKAAPQPPIESSDPVEEAVLALMAGLSSGRSVPVIEWEGTKYRVDPAAAEMARLRRVRERQGGLSIDRAIAQLLDADRAKSNASRQAQDDLVETLMSLVYAPHLGDPDGPALAAANVALRHDFAASSAYVGLGLMGAWRLPSELFGGAGGWHVQGSLLGLEVALRRLSLRRMDAGHLPSGPKLPILERQTATLTAALINPHLLTDDGRDGIAAALARGRQRVDALRSNEALLNDVADASGLSEWRREALKWSLANTKTEPGGAFTLVELFWLGAEGPRRHEWGAAALPLTGCLCLQMPDPLPWESLMGRPASGLLATLGVDLNLRLVEALSKRKLPASLLPAVLAFAMQDVIDEASPAYFDDWPAFWRAAQTIEEDRIDDFISALTANGPLVPASRGSL